MSDLLTTPSFELVGSLRNSAPHGIRDAGATRELWLINQAYAAGWKECSTNREAELQKARDEELDACEALILKMRPHGGRAWTLEQAAVNGALTAVVTELRTTRRPSLKKRIAAAIEDGDERTAMRLLNEALPE